MKRLGKFEDLLKDANNEIIRQREERGKKVAGKLGAIFGVCGFVGGLIHCTGILTRQGRPFYTPDKLSYWIPPLTLLLWTVGGRALGRFIGHRIGRRGK